MICRLAAHYGGWPHEVAAFPYSYYLAMRDSWLREIGLLRPAKPKSDLPYEIEGDRDLLRD